MDGAERGELLLHAAPNIPFRARAAAGADRVLDRDRQLQQIDRGQRLRTAGRKGCGTSRRGRKLPTDRLKDGRRSPVEFLHLDTKDRAFILRWGQTQNDRIPERLTNALD